MKRWTLLLVVAALLGYGIRAEIKYWRKHFAVEPVAVTNTVPAPCESIPAVAPSRYVLGTAHVGDTIGYGTVDGFLCISINGAFTKACFRMSKEKR